MPGTTVIADPWADRMSMVTPLVVDLDGDGWLDLVGGQPSDCLSNCGQPAAATYQNALVAVWPGGPTGFPALPTFELESPDRFRNVAVAANVGDTNGDGVTELLFADPIADNGQSDEGKLWLAAGAAGALGPLSWSVEGGVADRRLGETAQALGDVNGDGYDDLLLGLTGWYQNVLGRAVAFYGGPTGFAATPDWVSAPLPQTAGQALAAGDIDGDGFADAFVGAPNAPNQDGHVYGFRGGPAGFATNPDWTLAHPPDPLSPRFGEQVLVLPDLNGDGYPELAVSAPGFESGSFDGKVEVFEGGPAGPATMPTWTFLGPEPDDSLGAGLAAGDVDGDGLTDLLMTVREVWRTPGRQEDGQGGLLVVLGVPGGLSSTPAYVLRGPHGGSCFGDVRVGYDQYERAVQVADLDHDGRDDLLYACATQLLAHTWDGSIVVAYGGVDTDADGVTDTLDCEPTDPDIHPGADEIGYDGVDQDCAGGDDFDLDDDGAQAVPWGTDEDDRDTEIALSLEVTGSCTGALDLVVEGATAGATVEVYRGGVTASEGYLPFGHPCRDVLPSGDLHLYAPVLLGSAVADGSGHTVLPSVPAWAAACSDLVQAIDVSACVMSGTHSTPP